MHNAKYSGNSDSFVQRSGTPHTVSLHFSSWVVCVCVFIYTYFLLFLLVPEYIYVFP